MPADRAHIRRSALAAAASVVLAAGFLAACDPEDDTASGEAGPADTDTAASDHPGTCAELFESGTDAHGWAACCDTLRAWCEAEHPGDDEAVNRCTFGPDMSGAETGCIPWGPPVPPRASFA